MRYFLSLIFFILLYADSVPNHPINRVMQRGDLVCSVTSYDEIIRTEILESEESQSTGCFLNLYENGTSSASCIVSTSCPDQSSGNDYGGYYGTGGYDNTIQRYCYQVDVYRSTVDWCCSADSYINETCNESNNNSSNISGDNDNNDDSQDVNSDDTLDSSSSNLNESSDSDQQSDGSGGSGTSVSNSDSTDSYGSDLGNENEYSDSNDNESDILDELQAIHDAIGDNVDTSPLQNVDSSYFDELKQFISNFQSDMVSMGKDFENLKNMFKNGFDPNSYHISSGCPPKFSVQIFGQSFEIDFCPAVSVIRPYFIFVFTIIFLYLSLRILFIGIKYDR